MSTRVRFVEDKDFLRSAFDFGITFDDGVRELVDNALDAEARNIWIQLIKQDDDKIRIIVADDGKGIPTTYDGERQGIPYIMAFGGRIGSVFAPDAHRRIGRFGFGLSQTITCLARERGYAEVWTKNDEDPEWRMSYYSFQDLIDHDCHLPEEETKPIPPWIPPGELGTIVLIDVEDSGGMRPGAAQTRLLKFMGRTYRRYLADGCSISISSITGKKQSTKRARIKDPLALLDGSEEVEVLGHAVEYEVPPFVFDEDCPLGEIIDPDTGEPAVINFRLSRMPAIQVRKRLGLPLSGVGGVMGSTRGGGFGVKEDTTLKKWGIGYDGQGFSLMREGREIDSAITLGLFTKHHSQYGYMHGEVDFPMVLDDCFNVQTNKSRYTLSRELMPLLKSHIQPHLGQLYRDHKKAIQLNLELERQQKAEPQAETIGKQVAPLLPQPPLTDDDRKRSQDIRQDLANSMKDEAKSVMAPLIEEAEAKLAGFEEAGEMVRIREAESQLAALHEQQEEWLERIQGRWSTSAPSRLLEGELYSGELYGMEDAGDEAHITVNTGTAFWDRVYNEVRNQSHLRTLLDLMLSSLGYAEFIDGKTRPERGPFWRRVREEVSLHTEQFVKVMPSSTDEGGES